MIDVTVTHGHFEFKIKIGGFTVAQVTGSYSINVNPGTPPPGPLTLTPASGNLPDETVGQPATGSIAISGGTPPYSLVSATNLPAGVSAALDSGGTNVVLSGSPTTPGTVSPTIIVGDSAP